MFWRTLMILALFFSSKGMGAKASVTTSENQFQKLLEQIKYPEKITAFYKFKSAPADVKTLLVENKKVLNQIEQASRDGWKNTEFGNWYTSDEKVINKYFVLTQLLILKARSEKNPTPLFWGLEMVQNWLKSPKAFISLRLGGAVRSLLFDELEAQNEYFTKNFTHSMNFFSHYQVFPNVRELLLSEANAMITQLTSQTPTEAYKSFGPFVANVIRKHPAVFDKEWLQKQKTQTLQYVDEEFRKNPYRSVVEILNTASRQQVVAIEKEMGRQFYFLEALGGVALSDRSVASQKKIQYLSNAEKEQIESKWFKIENPLGKLYLVLLMNHWEHLWNEQDIVLYKMDMSRLNMFRTKVAVQIFKNKFKRPPQNVNELVQKQILTAVPYDYFSGKVLNYSAQSKIWSVGENTLDDGGAGDDLTLSLTPSL